MSNADMMEVLGVRQADIIPLLRSGTSEMNKFKQSLEFANGTTEQMAKVNLKSLESQMKYLEITVSDLRMSFLSGLVAGIDTTSKTFDNFSSNMKNGTRDLGTVIGFLEKTFLREFLIRS